MEKFSTLNQSLKYKTKKGVNILGFIESEFQDFYYAIPERGDKFLISKDGNPKTGHAERFLEIVLSSVPKFGDKVIIDMTIYNLKGRTICYNIEKDIITVVPEEEWDNFVNNLNTSKITSTKGVYIVKNPKFKKL